MRADENKKGIFYVGKSDADGRVNRKKHQGANVALVRVFVSYPVKAKASNQDKTQ